MVLCEDGTEALVEVCIVDHNLEVKLHELVKPEKAIKDYRTEITGVSSKDLETVTRSLADIQKLMKKWLSSGAILVGHSLYNDLRVLKLYYDRVVDTAYIFQPMDGATHRRPSLNSLCQEYPDYVPYITPMFFCDDWLNLYLDNFRMNTYSDRDQQNKEICCSDYRFVYMGVKGSWTPLHADVFRSYSWSANVCGKKRWFFLDPSQCHLVFDRNMKSCVYNIFDEVSDSKYPSFKKAIWLECTQEAGEIIFVPSGWYHQVHNLEDTLSINHNWFNAYNLSWVWNLLLRDYNEAKEYIEDIKDICDDFEGLCQRNLAANTGMNFYDFFTFISYFTLANLVLLCYINRRDGSTTGNSSRVAQHLSMNIGSIRKIASEMKHGCGLEGNHDCVVDMIKTFEDPRFSKFCMQVGKAYLMIHGQSNLFSDSVGASMVDLVDLGVLEAHTSSQVYAPEDLIKFIDNAIAKLDDFYIKLSVQHVA